MNLDSSFHQSRLQQYFDSLKVKQTSSATIDRKISSLNSFRNFLIKKGYLKSTPTPSFDKSIPAPNLIKNNNFLKNTFLSRYLIFGTLIALILGLGYGLYTQAILKAKQELAYSTASAPVRAGRILSFQGRLTDTSGNPITSSTSIVFKLFTLDAGGTQLYTSEIGNSQTVLPDENGIFSVVIGKSHGTEIPPEVFTENPEVWLEITADSEIMDPRQHIATVAYAINSETLQGLPPSASGLKDTVLVIDSQGNLNLGETSPTIKSTSGTLAVEGQALLLKASDGSGGNITINPDGNGTIRFLTEGTSPNVGGFADFSNNNIAGGNLINSQINNDNFGYNFISFQNYDSGTTELSTRFSIGASGNVYISNNLNAGGTITFTGLPTGTGSTVVYIDSSGNLVSGALPAGTIYTASNGITLVASDFQIDPNYSNNWLVAQNFASDIGLSGNLTIGGTFVSVGSTNLVSNLNADLLDGHDSTYFLDFGDTGPFIQSLTGGSGISLSGTGIGRTITNTGLLSLSTLTGNLTLTGGTDVSVIAVGNTLQVHDTSTLQTVTNRGASTTNQLTINYPGAPLVLSSGDTTTVTNLSADLLDGYNSDYFINVGQTGSLPYVNNAYSDATLTRYGTGPYTLGLNLASTNTWTGLQTFNTGTTNAPFAVGSSVMVANLNAQYLGGHPDTYFLDFGDTGPFIQSLTGGSGISLSGTGIGRTITNTGVLSLSTLTGNLTLTGGTDVSVIAVGNTLQVHDTSTLQTVTNRGASTTNQITINYAGAPFVLSSGNTTTVTNLSADLLDGYNSDYFVNVGQTGSLPYVNNAYSDATLTRYGAGPYTLGLNLGSTNTWTVLQKFTTGIGVTGLASFTNNIVVGGTFVSVGSTNLVSNLNADYLDGYNSDYFINIGQTGSLPYVNNAYTDATLTRYGTGPYTLGLNLGSTNTWTALQKFTSGIGVTGNSAFTNNLAVGGTIGVSSGLTISGSGGFGRFTVPASGGNMTFTLNYAGTLYERMTLEAGGQLGIGTTDPAYKLEVAGDALISTRLGIGSTSGIYELNVIGDSYTSQNLSVGGSLNVSGAASIGTTLTTASLNLTNTAVGGSSIAAYLSGNSGLIGYLDTSSWDKSTSDDYAYWVAKVGNTVSNISTGNTLTFTAGTGIGMTFAGNVITINNTSLGTTYAAGVGLSLRGDNTFDIKLGAVGLGLTTDASNQLINSGVLSVTGTANQISVAGAGGTGALTLSLPQGIGTTSDVTFRNLTLGGTFVSVGSTNLVSNLNADYLDSHDSTYFLNIGNSGDFIRNQFTGAQTANFWINGNALVGTKFGVGATHATAIFNVVGDANITTSLSVGTSLDVGSTAIIGSLVLDNTAVGTGTTILYISSAGVVTKGTLPASSSYTAGNGITLASTVFKLGSTLTEVTNIGMAAGSPLNFYAVGGTHALTIGTSGYLGLGTTNPTYKLHVVGDAYVSTSLTVGNTITATNILANQLVRTNATSQLVGTSGTANQILHGNLSWGDVLLGTETSGNYVSTVIGNSQIAVTGTAGEGVGVSLSIVGDSIGDTQLAYNTGQHLTTTSDVIFDQLYLANSGIGLSTAGSVNIGASLTVGTQIYAPSLTVGTGTSVVYINASTGQLTEGLLGPYDNYNYWVAKVGNTISNITTGSTLTFTPGSGIGMTFAGNVITVNNTGLLSLNSLTGNLSLAGGTGTSISTVGNTLSVNLTNTGVTAATYGSGTSIPTFTVDAQGRITSASQVLANFESPLTFNNGLTRSGNAVGLGGTLSSDTKINLSSFDLSFLGLGNTQSLFLSSIGNVGIGVTDPTYKLEVIGDTLGSLFRIADSSNNTLVDITDVNAEFNLPTIFNNSGNVSNAYDLIFTNPTASYIKSQAPLFIQTVDPTADLDLTLYAANDGQIVLDDSVQVTSNLSAGGSVTFTALPIGTGTTILYIDSAGVVTQGSLSANSYTASNGITLAGTVFKLGSTLTENTTIGTSSFNLSFVGLGGTQSLFIGASGYVGIGTTNPTEKLDISGNVRVTGASPFYGLYNTSWNATTYIQNGLKLDSSSGGNYTVFSNPTSKGFAFARDLIVDMMIDTNGYVGIGTTNPIQKLHVEGNCITSDSLLSIRRRRKKKNGEVSEDNDEFIWDEYLERIDRIIPGDEVLSLDEETGDMTYSKINKLMDMGFEEIYEVVTKSGKKIKTTAGHPYLSVLGNI